MEALRQKALKAEASAEKDAERFTQGMVKATESTKTACRTLRLALNDMGERVQGVPREDASVFDFSEWTQQAGGAQFGCEHVAEFPNFAKGGWEVSCQDVSLALCAWRKQFGQKDGRSTTKARLLEQLAKAEAANQGEEAAAGEGGGDAQDHPEL
uniref:Uncharacterized protein n=1 Tax=Oryza nivara TaxID=4536 RepID=A0A0E0IB11_ORYNI